MSKKHKKNKHKKEGKHLGRICCDNQAPDRSGAISISCGLALKEAKKQKHQNIPSELRLDMQFLLFVHRFVAGC